MSIRHCFAIMVLAAGSWSCTPTVAVAPEGPIELNINVKIEHEIKVQVDKELDDLFADDSELF
ncbi:MAG: YnbE family lipoprotein [Congregibacter sp.]|nr:YnbE family lipoprotein [Congregibacter sp.]